MDKQLKIRLKILPVLLFLILLPNLFYFLVKTGGFIFLIEGFIQLLLFIWVAIWTVILLWRIIRKPEWRKQQNFLTILSIPFAILISGYDKLKADENTFQSKVKIKACYEGTMNTSRLYFRENGTFEDYNIGFLAYVSYVSGTWKMNGDTILLTIKSGQNNLLKDKMLIRNKSLYAVEKDTIKPTFYYSGECKGLN
jgi:hypothetical protein